MKFFNYIRLFQLINWHICRYSVKCLYYSFKGDPFLPTFNPDDFENYLDKCFSPDGDFKGLPMGAYEYECCIIYLKTIRKTMLKEGPSSNIYTIDFSRSNPLGYTLVPLKDCLQKVTNDCGLKIIDNPLDETQCIYTLEMKN